MNYIGYSLGFFFQGRIYEITKSLSFPMSEQERKVKALPETQAPAIADLEWPPQEEEIVITLDK